MYKCTEALTLEEANHVVAVVVVVIVIFILFGSFWHETQKSFIQRRVVISRTIAAADIIAKGDDDPKEPAAAADLCGYAAAPGSSNLLRLLRPMLLLTGSMTPLPVPDIVSGAKFLSVVVVHRVGLGVVLVLGPLRDKMTSLQLNSG